MKEKIYNKNIEKKINSPIYINNTYSICCEWKQKKKKKQAKKNWKIFFIYQSRLALTLFYFSVCIFTFAEQLKICFRIRAKIFFFYKKEKVKEQKKNVIESSWKLSRQNKWKCLMMQINNNNNNDNNSCVGWSTDRQQWRSKTLSTEKTSCFLAC